MAALVSRWQHFGPGDRFMFESDAQDCISIMTDPDLSVQYQTDFATFDARRLAIKVNLPVPSENIEPGPWNDAYNWMRVTLGYDGRGRAIVAIVYHLLRHRIVNREVGVWSSSVGFDPDLLPDVPGAGHAHLREYIDFAVEVSQRMKVDLTSDNFKPSGRDFVIYDQPDLRGEGVSGEIGSNEASRRDTKIGELGWVAEREPAVIPGIFTKVGTPHEAPPPRDQENDVIPGWSRDGTEPIIVTELTVT